MAGKPGRSGRPPSASRKHAFQVRLEDDEAAAFKVYVEQKAAQASVDGATANAATILRGIVRDVLLRAGLLGDKVKPLPVKPAPKPAAAGKTAR